MTPAPRLVQDLGLLTFGSVVGVSAHLPEGANYGLAAIGLLIGTVTRYGMRLKDEQPITVREVVIDVMLLGMVTLLALWAIERLNAHGLGAVGIGAMFAFSQDRAIRTAQRLWDGKIAKILALLGLGDPDDDVEDEKPKRARRAKPARPIPPPPDDVPDTREARVGAALKRAHRKSTKAKVPPDMIEALRKLDGD